MINWVEFCMKNHLSLNSVKDLSVLLVKYLPSFYNDYTHLLDYVYQDSSLAQFIMPFVVCGACKKPFFTDSILCPECSQPFISSCTRCNINKVDYTIDTTMRCNHLDRVASKETQCFFVLTPEAFICLMYENSFDSFFVCHFLSQMDDLISYCKETGVISQFTDLNTGKILNHCGFPEYQERIKELHSHNHGDNMFLKQFTPDDMKNTQEEKLFHVFCIDLIII